VNKRLFILVVFFFTALSARDVYAKDIFRAVPDDDGVQRIEIIGDEYSFDPDHIIVKVNVAVELKVRKKSFLVPHNIIIDEPDAGIVFKESFGTSPKVIRFTPQKTGTFAFYCDKKLLFFKSHREKGMEGVLEVTE
jgi:plastocyanin domain-containing protein